MTQAQSKIDAIKIAMDAEQQAHRYYSQSAQKATSPKGKNMFNQLAAFELNHYNYLKSLLTSLQEGSGWTSYSGTQFSETAHSSEAKNSSAEEGMKDDVLSILSKPLKTKKMPVPTTQNSLKKQMIPQEKKCLISLQRKRSCTPKS